MKSRINKIFHEIISPETDYNQVHAFGDDKGWNIHFSRPLHRGERLKRGTDKDIIDLVDDSIFEVICAYAPERGIVYFANHPSLNDKQELISVLEKNKPEKAVPGTVKTPGIPWKA